MNVIKIKTEKHSMSIRNLKTFTLYPFLKVQRKQIKIDICK